MTANLWNEKHKRIFQSRDKAMHDKLVQQISRMSIRARVAFGLVCIERAMRQFGMDRNRIKLLLQGLWRYTEAEDLSDWNCAMDVEQLRDACGETVSLESREVLAQLFSELDEIGGGNLFGAFRNEFTLTPATNLVAIVVEHKIELPDPGPFIRVSPRRPWNAWGRRFEMAELRGLIGETETNL